MNIVGWRAFYTENREFESSGDLLECFAGLPDDGLLAVVLYHDQTRPDGHPYRTMVSCPVEHSQNPYGHDYCYAAPSENGLMWMFDPGPPKKIKERHPGAIIKKGKGVDDTTFKRINKAAMMAVECPECK